jgi:drug/metabolite transporter (DMT)-like permease
MFLIAGILCSASLVLFFKKFSEWNVRIPQAIAFNYLVCVLTGLALKPSALQDFSFEVVPPWSSLALALGILFITTFTLSSLTAVAFGASVAAMGMKLGLVFPVMLGIWYYGEPGSLPRYAGILLAFMAMILASRQPKEASEKVNHKAWQLFLPAIVFLGSGMCDTLVQYAQKIYFSQGGFDAFLLLLFLIAGVLGSLRSVYEHLKGIHKFKLKNLGAGILLGIPNYFSIWFLLKALQSSELGSSAIFVLYNIGTVLTAALISGLFMGEKFSKMRIAALILGSAAVALISLA